VYFVYILANKYNGTIYIGKTYDLPLRVSQHKEGIVKGFTKKFGINKLVYFEATEIVYAAVTRERQMKEWKRDWKVQLIEKDNPEWRDLYEDIV